MPPIGGWADCLEMVRARHPQVAEDIIRGMHGRVSDCLSAVQDCAAHLQDVGAQLPTWEALAGGVRPATSLEEEKEPSQARGWQKHASVSVQSHHREHVPQLNPAERAMVRSQSGPLSSVPFTAMPTNRVTRFEAEQFRVLLLRRLRLPLPLVRRPWTPPCSVQQIRGSGQERVRGGECCCSDLPGVHETSHLRRIPMVDVWRSWLRGSLCLFGGCQLALDATLVSPLHGDGTHRRGADITDGTALGEPGRTR